MNFIIKRKNTNYCTFIMNKLKKNKIILIENLLKYLIVFCGILGIFLCLINAKYDGYSHWTKRLLYFTNQSNLWVVLIYILSLLPLAKTIEKSVFFAKYIFTVCISLTSLMFCSFLGPFADKSYHAWSVSGILTHVITPVLVIIEFFIQRHRFFINKKAVLCTLIPPLIYLTCTSILFFINLDFGRGENFPYFFLNYFSPAKLLGFSNELPYFMGTFYWFILILLIILSLGIAIKTINNRSLKNKLNKDKSTSKNG